ncbi:hypothetical protein F5Y17DRAFT_442585 [Xylariaceae sp. FL0594]|nr:hypothetical protein F5Y17DRAFT_442585 [Xylariaceae sp. FL0594]
MAARKARDSKGTETDYQYTDATPICVSRSDGTEMPAEYNHYEKVEEGARPIIEWQNKLGQALAAELKPGVSGQFFLQDFPTHYHLRWYQAKDENKKTQPKHYYLFGYPEDSARQARKYFRSPNQFLPHLLWLAGESRDRGDCACEFCSGSKPITSKGAKVKAPSSAAQGSSSTQGSSSAQGSSSTQGSSVAQGPAPVPAAADYMSSATRKSVQDKPASSSTKAASTSLGTASSTAQVPAPSSQASGTTNRATTVSITGIAHDHDALFRAGEVVWLRNNSSWRVGMVLTSAPTLTIVPFGHPLYPTQEVTKAESEVRPFLAFSIPQIAPSLQEHKGRALADMDWEELVRRLNASDDPARREALAVEATKLAATRVDHCYSMFNFIRNDPAVNFDFFGGVFLGAEKLCVREPVRIKLSRDQMLEQPLAEGMPVVMIIERIMINNETLALLFEGSLWGLQQAKVNELTPENAGLGQGQLPTAMRGEKEFRDSLLWSRELRVDWVLLKRSVVMDAQGVRGRFYETRRLMPILDAAKFQEVLDSTRPSHVPQIPDIQKSLNNQGDSSGPTVGRVPTRAYAVAGAVPSDIPASLGPDVVEA